MQRKTKKKYLGCGFVRVSPGRRVKLALLKQMEKLPDKKGERREEEEECKNLKRHRLRQARRIQLSFTIITWRRPWRLYTRYQGCCSLQRHPVQICARITASLRYKWRKRIWRKKNKTRWRCSTRLRVKTENKELLILTCLLFFLFILNKVHRLRLLYFSLSYTARFTVQYKDGIWLKGQSFTWVSLPFVPIDRLDFRAALQQRTARPLLALAHLQRRSGGHLENFPHAVLGLGGALQVSESADPAGHVAAFLCLDGFLRGQVTGGQQWHH